MAYKPEDGRAAMQMGTVLVGFDFNNEYRKGALNTNADVLSCCHEEGTIQQNVAATLIDSGEKDLQKAQQQDQYIAKIYDHLVSSPIQPSDKAWKQQPLKRYKQIWPQLLSPDDIVQTLCQM